MTEQIPAIDIAPFLAGDPEGSARVARAGARGGVGIGVVGI
jgi:hypothetical protein